MALQDSIALLSAKIASVPEADWNAASAASGNTWVQQDFQDNLSIAFQRNDTYSYHQILSRADNILNFLSARNTAAFNSGTFTQGEVSTQGAEGDWLTGLGLNPFTTQEQDTRIRPAPPKPGELSWKTIAIIAIGLFLVYKFI
jgi:hypothetical protein